MVFNDLEKLRKDEKYIKHGKDMNGRKVSEENLDQYELIFKKNDERKKESGKNKKLLCYFYLCGAKSPDL